MDQLEWEKETYVISDEKDKIDLEKVHQLLSQTYWAKDRTLTTIRKSMKHSVVFGVYDKNQQIGFGRVVSDYTVFSWLLDVVIDPSYQGKEIGSWLVKCILNHPELKETKFALATKDAHAFYEKFNFETDTCMRRK
ncbi:GNAT family N-acetyltransferase [Saliterribacillus persicus]|uniref:GNAT family N-acetyltransferase n=1 Tax=Saliterribacillus persicus TaxID=930114 RepID=UPI003CCC7FFC